MSNAISEDYRSIEELCALDAELQSPYVVQITAGHQNEDKLFYSTFTFYSDEKIESYWYGHNIKPPLQELVGNSEKVVAINSERKTLSTIPSPFNSLSIDETYRSYAYLSDYTLDAFSKMDVIGIYPLAGRSKLIQNEQFNHNDIDTHVEDKGNHHAVDLASPRGTDVITFGSGVIGFVEERHDDTLACGREHAENSGNLVIVLQDNGLEALYGHLKQNSISVEVGDIISPGVKLGEVGCWNGCDVVSHLHFQVGGLTNKGMTSFPLYFYKDDETAYWKPQLFEEIFMN